MALKSIFVATSGGAASDGAIDIACRLALQTGAHLEAFHAMADPADVISMASAGYDIAISSEWIDQLIKDADEAAAKARAAFAATIERHGLTMTKTAPAQPSASWRVETGYAPILVARRARFFDLTVLGRSERVVEHPHSDTIEEALIRSGRPVLLAPAKAPASIGETIVVGWNGSPEAVHALTAALPLLAKARTVHVITVDDVPTDDGPPLLDYLASHGISATHHRSLPVKGVGPGEQVLAEARDAGADLLVMGGYGHRPWREILFGGATRQVIGMSLLPVLLAH